MPGSKRRRAVTRFARRASTVSVELRDARARAADRRPRVAEDDEAPRPAGGHDDGRRDRAYSDLNGAARRMGGHAVCGRPRTAPGSCDHVEGNSRRRRGGGHPGGGGRADRGGRLVRRTGCPVGGRGRGGAGPGRGGVLHGGAGRRRVDGVCAPLRRVPRRRARRGGSAGPARGRLPERLGRADDGRAVRVRARRDAPRPSAARSATRST